MYIFLLYFYFFIFFNAAVAVWLDKNILGVHIYWLICLRWNMGPSGVCLVGSVRNTLERRALLPATSASFCNQFHDPDTVNGSLPSTITFKDANCQPTAKMTAMTRSSRVEWVFPE